MDSRTRKRSANKERELIDALDLCYLIFPEDFISELNIQKEYKLVDDRKYTNSSNQSRYLDQVISINNNRVVAIEFKSGVLTAQDIEECGVVRGYFELVDRQVKNCDTFLFVGEKVSDAATDLASVYSLNSGTTIKVLSYSTYIQTIFMYYLNWALSNGNKWIFISKPPDGRKVRRVALKL
ncbi:MAG: hypothetical protein F6K50_05640 [Moorea sp. SIO3I7]|nr:hypothetical protein [Moorena sp. SIO3I7]